MNENNPFVDDRAKQQSLFGDQDATRTIERESQTVTGSEEFMDDRDQGGGTETEQAGLFANETEIEDQQALGGGMATERDENAFFEDTAETEEFHLDERIEEAQSAGVLAPEPPNGDSDLAPDEIFNTQQETRTIEFGRRDAALEARDELPDEALGGQYDRRHKKIELVESELPERKVSRITGMAADSKAFEEEKVGQAPLTERERKDIDFGETSVPEARSVKAIMLDEGVDDFTSYFDPTLTVDEHREIAKQAARDDQGIRREDTTSAVEREAEAYRAEQRGLRDHAIKGAKMGDEEAIQTLIQEVGMSEERARGFAEAASTDRQRAEIVDTVVRRAKANGRFLNKARSAPRAPGKRRVGNGRFAGKRIVDPNIGRDPQTGQFVHRRE